MNVRSTNAVGSFTDAYVDMKVCKQIQQEKNE